MHSTILHIPDPTYEKKGKAASTPCQAEVRTAPGCSPLSRFNRLLASAESQLWKSLLLNFRLRSRSSGERMLAWLGRVILKCCSNRLPSQRRRSQFPPASMASAKLGRLFWIGFFPDTKLRPRSRFTTLAQLPEWLLFAWSKHWKGASHEPGDPA